VKVTLDFPMPEVMNLADFTWVVQAGLIVFTIAALTHLVREMFNGEWKDDE